MTARSERAPIRRLSPEVVHRIAAGEVVERPASVVKELVENALDAGATEVTVELQGGGLEGIEVRDDGDGIPSEELTLAVERYATSKLGDADGLESIGTLGFRGEALAAIAAVSHLSIASRVRAADAGATISVDGGAVGVPASTGRAVGTTVRVRDLFYNVPARRKFLRGAAAEQLAVGDVIDRLYLARPDLLLTVTADGRVVRQYPRATGAIDAAARVLGSELLDHAVEVADGPADGVTIAGVVGRPSLHRGTSHGVYLAVNGRAVESKPLAQAIRLAYRDYLPPSRFPVAVVHLTIDPTRVDVNVHPTKREIRIARERDVAERLRVAVRRAIREGSHTVDRDVPHREPTSDAEVSDEAVGGGVPSGAISLAAIPASRQRTLVDREPAPAIAGTSRHPSIRLLGSIFDLYWLGESDGALVLVDQHAASERVVFEALRSGGGLVRQELMDPLTLRLTARRAEALAAHAAPVDAAGFTVEPFGGDAWRLRAVPSYRGRRARPQALLELLDELADGARPTLPDGLEERVAASIACHSAVRAGDVIEAAEMGRILGALFGLGDAAFACPHGRPVVVQVPRSRLDRWFLRPGA
ncbi:MAG: DNA mismatch repair endonuclease MutL [Thermoplasmata archaeon]|nr:DNA mismatch repair endonuclease MutL [Thermoplasmata archaeon]